ncbi:NAD(P)/FAD-dependent oxidoreductase [Mucilaginibacter sabulilitoris]|uniref:NAD(P)/FAD-dependent oxidoreductase n=1 Tax=Mucilaginibacter sabulilitoris TaxID=1173583 RepID=A0ABZ0TRF6_9SPHI|nr:NAD(P)/FAD-dependent oxidoreductase [Mucilaginibacter sabulilitoris]WPU95017.1 NAD(P)/FAD-dependent oxidoreductase [Mucilaginibacter sabulilitoris]
MNAEMDFDVIIVGGSYAGLSAAMALGRALRKVLVIDGGKPCNRQTPHSHNFLTRDGETPAAIASIAKEQLAKYTTVKLVTDFAIEASKLDAGFQIITRSGTNYTAKKILFATGIIDIMPAIPGFAECWGISVLHCPYCHGYEVRHQPTGILGNGDAGFELAKLISNWTNDITFFTNGKSTLSAEQEQLLVKHNIKIIETEVQQIVHDNGQIKNIILQNNEAYQLTAMYARLPFNQHSDLPQQFGCDLTNEGYIAVDGFYHTSIPGIYAAGDNATMVRSVAVVVAAGMVAAAAINRDMITEEF